MNGKRKRQAQGMLKQCYEIKPSGRERVSSKFSGYKERGGGMRKSAYFAYSVCFFKLWCFVSPYAGNIFGSISHCYCHQFGRWGVQIFAIVNNLEGRVCKSLQLSTIWKVWCANPCNCLQFGRSGMQILELSAIWKVGCAIFAIVISLEGLVCKSMHLSSIWKVGFANPSNYYKFGRSEIQILRLLTIWKVGCVNHYNCSQFGRSGLQILPTITNSEGRKFKSFDC